MALFRTVEQFVTTHLTSLPLMQRQLQYCYKRRPISSGIETHIYQMCKSHIIIISW